MFDQFQRRRSNADQKLRLKEADISRFLRQDKRKAQKGCEPNDRNRNDKVGKLIERTSPEDMDLLINQEF